MKCPKCKDGVRLIADYNLNLRLQCNKATTPYTSCTWTSEVVDNGKSLTKFTIALNEWLFGLDEKDYFTKLGSPRLAWEGKNGKVS